MDRQPWRVAERFNSEPTLSAGIEQINESSSRGVGVGAVQYSVRRYSTVCIRDSGLSPNRLVCNSARKRAGWDGQWGLTTLPIMAVPSVCE